MTLRLSNVHQFIVPTLREMAGLHDLYDAVAVDLSPSSVDKMLLTLGTGDTPNLDEIESAQLGNYEEGLRFEYRDLSVHRSNPFVHIDNLDVSCYDREYAPVEQRTESKVKHLDLWPGLVDTAVATLDRVSAPMASAALSTLRNLEMSVAQEPIPEEIKLRSTAAIARLKAHLMDFEDPNKNDIPPALGRQSLERYLGVYDGVSFSSSEVISWAESEAKRLGEMLEDGLLRLRSLRKDHELTVGDLLMEYPEMDQVYTLARETISTARSFVEQKGLLKDVGGICKVGPAPLSRRWAMAMMSWNAPYEQSAPAMYYITPPSEEFTIEQEAQWMSVFSFTTLPAITVHEAIPGHFAHGQRLRSSKSEVTKTLLSNSFVEGWAHYGEELMLEEGFMSDDPRFQIGVAVEALVRIARVLSTFMQHAEGATVADAARVFEDLAHLKGPAAYSEAERALFDPTYARYSLGKKVIAKERDRAKALMGGTFSLGDFHDALLRYGSPSLGLVEKITELYISQSAK